MRYISKRNEPFRDEWVKTKLATYSKPGDRILDVGAGLQPYREWCERLNLNYISHDFNSYVPQLNLHEAEWVGLQNIAWNYPKPDFECEILDIPKNENYDLVICTEVFEHIPDPVRALEHITNLLKNGGIIILTVPFMSLMHQAPYWFQSGLSPFWFEFWGKEFELEILELSTNGDYIDLMSQEISRLASESFRLRGLPRLLYAMTQYLRRKIRLNVLQSGGFGTFFVARKI